jgi:hypothetical protein
MIAINDFKRVQFVEKTFAPAAAENINTSWTVLTGSAVLLALCGALTRAQVINFDVSGSAGAANYSGQGAYPDPGNNYWKPVVGGSAPDRPGSGLMGLLPVRLH